MLILQGQLMSLEYLIQFWKRHAQLILIIAVGLMSIAAVVWLTYEIWRFLWTPQRLGSTPIHPGAIDLAYRYREVQAWFA
jgi:hypothetical protein